MKLALGTVQFGLDYGVANQHGRVSIAEAGKILDEAAAHGIDTLDTAISYGDSERTLGQIGVANWRIVSKLPPMPDDCVDVSGWVELEILSSIARLGVDRLYAILLHRPYQLFERRGRVLLAALERLKIQGLAKKIGVSVYAPDELERLFAEMRFDLVQAPLSILDRRLFDSGWAQRLQSHGVELHVRSVFLQGLLLMPTARRPGRFGPWQALWTEWERWLGKTGLTPLEACLRYALSVAEVDRVVVAVDNAIQLREILTATGGSLTSYPDWPQAIDVDLLNPSHWNYL